ncbi:hypothetical protein [Halobacillus sp. BBL2006]|uniref:hypothetical protein n=1 Tax=Halobacillus sp. BBL2006 TaxID=1543706 RepID=UPI00054406E4|nr:hypothetical protein [Halobacillus sp. BBL2006]KHE67129.1 hypothetical protein LD39_19125 [Halobacillus sp. BBL2006]
MFVSYTDASVKKGIAVLSFVIYFKDAKVIRKRIIVKESNNHIAEAYAISELLSFLSYYDIKNGLLLIDCNVVKEMIKRKRGKLYPHIPKHINYTLQKLNMRSQLILRDLNIAHEICSKNGFKRSTALSTVNWLKEVIIDSDYYIQFSVYEEYKQLVNKASLKFHDVLRQLNKLVKNANLVHEEGDTKLFENNNVGITLHKDTVVKVTDLKCNE